MQRMREAVGRLLLATLPVLMVAGVIATGLSQAADRGQSESVEPPPLADGFQPAEIRVPEGFTVELAAGPPLVTHPTMACFDDRGRLFVCNNAGVNMSAEELEQHRPNAIRLLEDRDGDGRFDRSTVFADRMTYPMGGAWHDGALYVASPPHIWRLEDTDGDGTADKRDVLVGTFGYTGNAASIHGCFFGPDGRLYWCDGYHGHEFRDETGKVTSRREGSYIFSCRPDGSDVRLHCGGGMDNPVEVDFTDTGDVLGSVNILYSRPRVDALVHWLHGGAYPHREKVLEEIKVTGELLGPMHEFGHVAVSGVRRYRSGALDGRWRDNFFATFFNAGKVVRLETARDGSTYRAVQREFLTGTSRDFHPTDVLEDADGSLLVIDTGGWFYRGCPTSQLSKPDVLGAIYRIRRTGMTKQDDPWGRRIDWEKLTDTQLVALLGDNRFHVREQAITACARRGQSIVPHLEQVIRRGDIQERQNALWALTRLAAGDGKADTARTVIRLALSDRAPSVRQVACRSIATYPDPAALDQLVRILRSDEPPVRREAAHALGAIGDARAVPALLEAIGRREGIDRSEEHAIIYALIEINDAATTVQGLAAEQPADVQRGALIALDQMDARELGSSDVEPLLDADDADLRQTALDILRRRVKNTTAPERNWWTHSGWATLSRWLRKGNTLEDRAPIARGLVTTLAAEDDVAALVGRTLADPKTPSETRRLLLDAIAAGNKLPLHESWVAPLERNLGSDDPQVVELALAAVSAIASDRFDEPLRRLASDDRQPTPIRLAALQALARRGTRLSGESFEYLTDLVDDGGPNESARAAQMLGASSLTPAQLRQLAPLLESAGPLVLRDLIRPFQRSADPAAAAAFLGAMEQARSLLSLPTSEVSDIVKRYPAELRPRANALLDRMRQHDEDQLAQVDRLLSLLDGGDPRRGREAFFSEQSKCATCHRVGEQGGKVGPDLSTIGANRSARDLLESIVFPSSSIVRQYEPYNVLTESGRSYAGLIVRETADALHVQQQSGEPVAVPRKEITILQPSTVSIMPKGLEQTLTEQQLADVVAWLMSLK